MSLWRSHPRDRLSNYTPNCKFSFVPLFSVMSQGLPSPNSSCDSLYPGRTGYPKGTLQSPGNSQLFQRIEGPVHCTKSLVPSDSQSLTLTVRLPIDLMMGINFFNSSLRQANFLQINSAIGPEAGGHEASSSANIKSLGERCETLCDERGCHCLIDGYQSLSLIDHMMVRARNGGRVACFCGTFAVSSDLKPPAVSFCSLAYIINDEGRGWPNGSCPTTSDPPLYLAKLLL